MVQSEIGLRVGLTLAVSVLATWATSNVFDVGAVGAPVAAGVLLAAAASVVGRGYQPMRWLGETLLSAGVGGVGGFAASVVAAKAGAFTDDHTQLAFLIAGALAGALTGAAYPTFRCILVAPTWGRVPRAAASGGAAGMCGLVLFVLGSAVMSPLRGLANLGFIAAYATGCVVLGLIAGVLADRIRPRSVETP